jgi:hypothetical protein
MKVLMDEELVEGKWGGGVGGCWMEQSIIMWKWKKVGKDNKHKHPSIHPSIHTIGLLRSTIVMTSL